MDGTSLAGCLGTVHQTRRRRGNKQAIAIQSAWAVHRYELSNRRHPLEHLDPTTTAFITGAAGGVGGKVVDAVFDAGADDALGRQPLGWRREMSEMYKV